MKLIAIGLGTLAVTAGIVAVCPPPVRSVAPHANEDAALSVAERAERRAQGVAALFRAYDEVFNDLAMLKDGKFGMSRVPHAPADAHTGLRLPSLSAARDPKDEANPIHRARLRLKDLGANWNEGVVSMSLAHETTDQEPPEQGWWTTDTVPGGKQPPKHLNWFAAWMAHDSKDRLFPPYYRYSGTAPAGLAKLSVEVKEWASNPKSRAKPFRRRIGEWDLEAQAVPYRHRECLSCHPGAKVGDVAAAVVVATRRESGT